MNSRIVVLKRKIAQTTEAIQGIMNGTKENILISAAALATLEDHRGNLIDELYKEQEKHSESEGGVCCNTCGTVKYTSECSNCDY